MNIKKYQVALSDISDTVTYFCQNLSFFFFGNNKKYQKKYNNAKLSCERTGPPRPKKYAPMMKKQKGAKKDDQWGSIPPHWGRIHLKYTVTLTLPCEFFPPCGAYFIVSWSFHFPTGVTPVGERTDQGTEV